jgi:hypothetical protein
MDDSSVVRIGVSITWLRLQPQNPETNVGPMAYQRFIERRINNSSRKILPQSEWPIVAHHGGNNWKGEKFQSKNDPKMILNKKKGLVDWKFVLYYYGRLLIVEYGWV